MHLFCGRIFSVFDEFPFCFFVFVTAARETDHILALFIIAKFNIFVYF